MNLESRFNELAESWAEWSSYHSNVQIKFEHPAYLEIIAMGEKAIPLILKRYNASSRLTEWDYVLNKITNEDPVAKKMQVMGIERMPHLGFPRLCWLEWGKERGYI